MDTYKNVFQETVESNVLSNSFTNWGTSNYFKKNSVLSNFTPDYVKKENFWSS